MKMMHFMLRAASLALALLPLGSLAAENSRTVELFNGRDYQGWRKAGEWVVAKGVALDTADNKKLAIAPGQGILVNGEKGKTIDLLTEAEFGDAELHVEFCVPKNSNSGVYLQARYEIQVFDSFGVDKPKYSDCGGVYERWKDNQGYEGHPPRVNASKAPGVWQSFDITFRAPRFDASGKKVENARFVKVLHNGLLVHENVEVTGPTRASTYEDEKPVGPLMLQGDHGPVAYRNLRLKPVRLK